MVSITLRVLLRPDVDALPKIYQSLGLDYDERVIPSIGNEVLKSIVAQFDAAELITQREVVSARIREDLVTRAREFNIRLEDVSITHLTFGKVRFHFSPSFLVLNASSAVVGIYDCEYTPRPSIGSDS
jgi:prohibitin 1